MIATHWRLPVAFLAIFVLGIVLRVSPPASSRPPGLDAYLYKSYVEALSHNGLASYPDLVAEYIKEQTRLPSALLPPTRFLYIFCGYMVRTVTGVPVLEALRMVSCGASLLALAMTGCFAWRVASRRMALGTFALMSVAPVQIFMARYPLIDGFFTCVALAAIWLLLENLRTPNRTGFLLAYLAATALLVLTKENSAFVMTGVTGILIGNRWLKLGAVTPALIGCTLAGPLLGVAILIGLSGGVDSFIETYRLLVTKAYQLDYAIKTGDGPWHRYLYDYALVSPAILLLAVASAFQVRGPDPAHRYLLAFICLTYLVMANVKFGMNLRYATIWDMPLRFLAAGQLVSLSGEFGKRRNGWLALLVACVCGVELIQYHRLFVESSLTELVTENLDRALKILK